MTSRVVSAASSGAWTAQCSSAKSAKVIDARLASMWLPVSLDASTVAR
jgi:hypothetical protein